MKRGSVGGVNRHARKIVRRFGKMHAPRQTGRFSPAAPGGETALPANRLPDGDARRKRVRHFPKREFIPANKHDEREKSADEPAVINAARTQEVERKNLHVL